jgi:AcrR family transcriptional regulator
LNADPSTPRQRATEETRGRVVRAARHVFAAHGYAGASMRQIAGEAGLTAMALYTYAPSKAALFQLVYDDGIERIYASFTEVVAGRPTLVDEVEAIVRRGGELLEQDPDLLRFTMRVATDSQHEDLRGVSLVSSPYRTFFDDLVRRAVRRGELGRTDAAPLVRFVTMLLWGVTVSASIDPASVDDAIDTAVWAARGRIAGT